jgi:hypothetical protein
MTALETIAKMHRVEGDLYPVAAMSVVYWVDQEGDDQVTIYIAQAASGVLMAGMLAQALHILNEETMGRFDG